MRKIILVLGFVLGAATNGKAQITASNPLDWMALAEGNELLEKLSSTRCANGNSNTTIT